MSNTTPSCWLDLRRSPSPEAIIAEALHQGLDGLVADRIEVLEALPPSVTRVLLHEDPLPQAPGSSTDFDRVDAVVAPFSHEERRAWTAAHPEVTFGRYVDVHDAASLEVACESAQRDPLTVILFRDPTKIPLEIVLAAGAGSDGKIITIAGDVDEAAVIRTVLEHGSDGVMMAGLGVGDATALQAAVTADSDPVKLDTLRVVRTRHVGMGERACIDTCSYLGKDEGILVGSTSKGMMLCVSETHPLPYMPTRPFRVNAGAIHSYTLGEGGRTQYLTELTAGDRVTAVRTDGSTRLVTVGRVKIESRPLISIDAESSDGRSVNLILQHDWHVRVLGPEAEVLNSTELRPGHVVLGHLPTSERHVGYPIAEFCREQ